MSSASQASVTDTDPAQALVSIATAHRQTPLTCSGHTRPIVDLNYSPKTPDGFFLISACKDGKPMLRQGDNGDWVGTFEGHKGAVWGAALDRQAMKGATGSADFSAKVWDAVSGNVLHTFDHSHIVKAVSFSFEGDRLATGCNDKIIRIFDLARSDAGPTELRAHTKSIRKAIWNPDGTRIISGGDDKCIRLWDIAGAGKPAIERQLDDPILWLELSPSGTVLTAAHGSTVSFWNPANLEPLKSVKMDAPTYCASLHPGGAKFVCGGLDNSIHVFDYASEKQIEEYKGHFGPIHCVQYSPDGEVYASGSEDGTIRLWQTTVGKDYSLWKFSSTEPDEPVGETHSTADADDKA